MKWSDVIECGTYFMVASAIIFLAGTLISLVIVMREDMLLQRTMRYEIMQRQSQFDFIEQEDGWKTINAIPLEK